MRTLVGTGPSLELADAAGSLDPASSALGLGGRVAEELMSFLTHARSGLRVGHQPERSLSGGGGVVAEEPLHTVDPAVEPLDLTVGVEELQISFVDRAQVLTAPG